MSNAMAAFTRAPPMPAAKRIDCDRYLTVVSHSDHYQKGQGDVNRRCRVFIPLAVVVLGEFGGQGRSFKNEWLRCDRM
jgi:hypothetical protein